MTPPSLGVERAEALFSQVDRNNDGDITEEEWVAACLQDQDMCAVLATNTGTENGGKVPNIFLAFTDFYFYCILRQVGKEADAAGRSYWRPEVSCDWWTPDTMLGCDWSRCRATHTPRSSEPRPRGGTQTCAPGRSCSRTRVLRRKYKSARMKMLCFI